MQEVISYLNSQGYLISDFIPDAKLRRFPLDREDRKNSGYYVGFRNFLQSTGEEYFTVLYGSWKEDEPRLFSTLKHQATALDKKKVDEQIRKAKREHAKEKKQLQDKAAELANELFAGFSDVFVENDYLKRKGLKELFGARIHGNELKVPMLDIEGNLRNIETIVGTAKFGLTGGQRIGLFHHIGELGEIVYIAEGFATAATIHMATGECAIAAFNAGNLVPVAEAIAKKYPELKIVICGDDDEIGIKKAEQAAGVAGGKFVIAQGANDFNDVYLAKGIDEVLNQINAIKPTEVTETFDPAYVIHQPYPDENPKSFAKLGTMANLEELLRRLKISVRYNVISKKEEILIPDRSFSMDNKENAMLGHILDWCERVKIPTKNLKTYLTAISDKKLYNPVATWVKSKPWDGESRLKDFFDTVHAPNCEIKEILMKKWLIGAIAAAFCPNGAPNSGILIFQGKQYMGKTKWFKSLAPAELDLLADGVLLRPDDKDSVSQVISKWIVELGEIDATFRKSDISQLKAYITKDYDTFRRPFAACDSTYARRTVFFASVNDEVFLNDPTGNRRFWTIECESIDHSHGVDMQQLWAEVWHLFNSGESWFLTDEELGRLNTNNEQFEYVDPIEERIKDHFGWGKPADRVVLEKMNATAICISLGYVNPTPMQQKAAARAVRKISGQKPDRDRKYWVPHTKIN